MVARYRFLLEEDDIPRLHAFVIIVVSCLYWLSIVKNRYIVSLEITNQESTSRQFGLKVEVEYIHYFFIKQKRIYNCLEPDDIIIDCEDNTIEIGDKDKYVVLFRRSCKKFKQKFEQIMKSKKF